MRTTLLLLTLIACLSCSSNSDSGLADAAPADAVANAGAFTNDPGHGLVVVSFALTNSSPRPWGGSVDYPQPAQLQAFAASERARLGSLSTLTLERVLVRMAPESTGVTAVGEIASSAAVRMSEQSVSATRVFSAASDGCNSDWTTARTLRSCDDLPAPAFFRSISQDILVGRFQLQLSLVEAFSAPDTFAARIDVSLQFRGVP